MLERAPSWPSFPESAHGRLSSIWRARCKPQRLVEFLDLIQSFSPPRCRLLSRFSNPAPQLARHQLPEHGHPGTAVIETGDCMEILAPIFSEHMCVGFCNLLERLQAVGRESGRDHDQI